MDQGSSAVARLSMRAWVVFFFLLLMKEDGSLENTGAQPIPSQQSSPSPSSFPPVSTYAGQQLLDAIAALEDLSSFLLALRVSGVDALLSAFAAERGVTVFAPSKEAFSVFGTELFRCLSTEPAARVVLSQIVSYHIIPDKVLSLENLQSFSTLQTAAGASVSLEHGSSDGEDVIIDEDESSLALFAVPDAIVLTNATVHVISAVLTTTKMESDIIHECQEEQTDLSSEAPPSFVRGFVKGSRV